MNGRSSASSWAQHRIIGDPDDRRLAARAVPLLEQLHEHVAVELLFLLVHHIVGKRVDLRKQADGKVVQSR